MRSSCLRLRKIREKGPRSLKLYEYISQLDQYNSVHGWDWRTNLSNFPKFIENTMKIISRNESSISSSFINKVNQCKQCQQADQTFILDVRIDKNQKEATIKDLVYKALIQQKTCCHQVFNLDSLEEKNIILNLSDPTAVNLFDEETINENRTIYRSHLEVKVNGSQAFFRFNN